MILRRKKNKGKHLLIKSFSFIVFNGNVNIVLCELEMTKIQHLIKERIRNVFDVKRLLTVSKGFELSWI